MSTAFLGMGSTRELPWIHEWLALASVYMESKSRDLHVLSSEDRWGGPGQLQ